MLVVVISVEECFYTLEACHSLHAGMQSETLLNDRHGPGEHRLAGKLSLGRINWEGKLLVVHRELGFHTGHVTPWIDSQPASKALQINSVETMDHQSLRWWPVTKDLIAQAEWNFENTTGCTETLTNGVHAPSDTHAVGQVRCFLSSATNHYLLWNPTHTTPTRILQ